jgi:hypothetical protein
MHLDYEIAQTVHSQHITKRQDGGGAVFGDDGRASEGVSRTEKLAIV